jgi:hypothetical protein
MCADRAISLTRLRPNGGKAAAKLRRETKVFGLISIKLKYLQLKRLGFAASMDVMKLRKIFHREAARRYLSFVMPVNCTMCLRSRQRQWIWRALRSVNSNPARRVVAFDRF